MIDPTIRNLPVDPKVDITHLPDRNTGPDESPGTFRSHPITADPKGLNG